MLRGSKDDTMRPAVFREEFRVTALFAFLTTANLGVEGVVFVALHRIFLIIFIHVSFIDVSVHTCSSTCLH